MRNLSKVSLTTAAALFACAATANAGVIYSVTAANGATAMADFAFGTNSLTLVLTNTTVDPGDIGYNLSAINFAFAGGTGATLSGASSPAFRSVDDCHRVHGTCTVLSALFSDAAGPNTPASVGWVFSQTLNTYLLDVLAGTGHAGPANTILGLPAPNGPGPADDRYNSANASIAGNGPHNPFLFNSSTFNFIFTGGVDADTFLTGVQFQFGTADDNFIPGRCTQNCAEPGGHGTGDVPEPGSLMLIIAALSSLLGLAMLARRRADA